MKKLFKTVAVVAAALAVGLLASCKTEADLGDAYANWKKVEDTKVAGAERTITLVADNADIDWWCWTDEKGQIIDNNDLNPQTGDRRIPKSDKTGKTFTMPEGGKEYRLNIYQSNKTVNPDGKDFRGKLKSDAKKGKVIKASNYGQSVSKQAEIWMVNDEPASGSYFYDEKNKFTGDYTIEEVWILEKDAKDKDKPNRGSNYIATESLKYKGLSIAGSATNTTKVGFLVPSQREIIITTEQPNRAKNADKKPVKYFKWADGHYSYYDGYEKDNKTPKEIGTTPAKDDGTDADYDVSKDIGTKTIYLTSEMIKEKKAEYWGARVYATEAEKKAANDKETDPKNKKALFLADHSSNHSSPLKTKTMSAVKFDRNGISNNFTNKNGKFANPIEYITVREGCEGEK